MLAYSDKFHITNIPLKDYEFVVLNELIDLSSRTDANCLSFRRFLFEIDDKPLDFQEKVVVPCMQDLCVSIVFSGKKSYHMVVEFGPEYESLCKIWYKQIWHFINKYYFHEWCDVACANPSRLTRRPGAIRKDTGLKQLQIYNNPGNYISQGSKFIKDLRAHLIDCSYLNTIEEKKRFDSCSKNSSISVKSHDGLCKNYSTVTYYLNKSFPNKTGNGDSSISLFKAVLTCMKYKDQQTLQEVLAKARRESWSEKEIDHIIRSIEKKYI